MTEQGPAIRKNSMGSRIRDVWPGKSMGMLSQHAEPSFPDWGNFSRKNNKIMFCRYIDLKRQEKGSVPLDKWERRTGFNMHGECCHTQQVLCLSLHWQSGFPHFSSQRLPHEAECIQVWGWMAYIPGFWRSWLLWLLNYSYILKKSWLSGKVPHDRPGENITPIFKKEKGRARELQAGMPHISAWKSMEQVLMEVMLKYLRDELSMIASMTSPA